MALIPEIDEGMGRVLVASAEHGTFSFVSDMNRPFGPTLLQRMVGGNIEFLVSPLDDGKDTLSVFGYEEARIFAKPQNRQVTHWLRGIYRYWMLGNFVIAGHDGEGRTMPMSNDVHGHMMKSYPGVIDFTDYPIARWLTMAKVINGG